MTRLTDNAPREWRVTWQRQGMARLKRRLFQVDAAAHRFALTRVESRPVGDWLAEYEVEPEDRELWPVSELGLVVHPDTPKAVAVALVGDDDVPF